MIDYFRQTSFNQRAIIFRDNLRGGAGGPANKNAGSNALHSLNPGQLIKQSLLLTDQARHKERRASLTLHSG